MNIQYLAALQRMAERVIDKTTRVAATAELRTHMTSKGFNEHTVVDLMLMCHAAGKVAHLSEPPIADA